jgi:hypothetical protein
MLTGNRYQSVLAATAVILLLRTAMMCVKEHVWRLVDLSSHHIIRLSHTYLISQTHTLHSGPHPFPSRNGSDLLVAWDQLRNTPQLLNASRCITLYPYGTDI